MNGIVLGEQLRIFTVVLFALSSITIIGMEGEFTAIFFLSIFLSLSLVSLTGTVLLCGSHRMSSICLIADLSTKTQLSLGSSQ
jgi:hypothetical protein